MSFDPIGFIFPKSGGSGGGSGGGLPVVDIQKSIFSITADEPIFLTEEEAAQLTALTAEDKAIIVNFWVNDPDMMNYPVPVLFALAFYAGEGTSAYTSMFGNSLFLIGLEGGTGVVSKLA